MERFIAILGIVVFIFLAFAVSRSRKAINFRLIFWTLLLQVMISFFVFRSSLGQSAFAGINDFIGIIIQATQEGPKFVFGGLADEQVTKDAGFGFILFFQGLVSILVISALLGILYHIGFMGFMLKIFARIFSWLTKISGAESLAATANIFVGNESMLAIRPCLAKLTKSEYCTLLATCMATISANVFVFYVQIIQGAFPSIAGHLFSASLLSVPAAVLLSKLAVPETEIPETLGLNIEPHFERENTIIEAILSGGESGFKMLVGITCMLIAVVGLLAIANAILGGCGNVFGSETEWRIESILGVVFYPFVWLMGVPTHDVAQVADLLGTRVIATEIPAYFQLADLIKTNAIEPRSAVIAAYALCGFAHIPSMAIYVGGATALAPHRKSDIASLAWKALAIATLSCLMTGAFAGIFFSESSILIE